MKEHILQRAQGCLMGQLAGDSLGSLVEFKTPEEIRRLYPHGVRDLIDGGAWDTLAGQPTDDSEMALVLARTLAKKGRYDRDAVRAAYVAWFQSDPFDCGRTVCHALRDDRLDSGSQANGALMRVSPLGIFGAREGTDRDAIAAWSEQDAALTHIHPLCVQVNQLFVAAIAQAVRDGGTPGDVYQRLREHARALDVLPTLAETLERAAHEPPANYIRYQGWVIIAFQNAVWQLLHAPDVEQGIVDTVMRGGDTDTNAAICGALLGAVHGLDALPGRWQDIILNCRPGKGSRARHLRPRRFWPVDALELAANLVLPQALLDTLENARTPPVDDKPGPLRFDGECPKERLCELS